MAVEVLGKLRYEPVAARNPDLYSLELHSTSVISGIDLWAFETGDAKQEWLDKYGVLSTISWFTENDRVPQTRRINGADESTTGQFYNTVLPDISSDKSYPEKSPALNTIITPGIGIDLLFPTMGFDEFHYSDFDGKPFSWHVEVNFEVPGGSRTLTIDATFYLIFTYDGFGGLINIEIDNATSIYDLSWDDESVEIVDAEIGGEAWASAVYGVVSNRGEYIQCHLRTPFYQMNIPGATKYTLSIVPTDLPLTDPFPQYAMRIEGGASVSIYGTKFIAKSLNTGFVIRSFRPTPIANLIWYYKQEPTSESNSDAAEWLYHDAGMVEFSSYANTTDWVNDTLPELPDSDNEGVYSFFALVTDIWGASGMVVVQVRNDAQQPPAAFIGRNGQFYVAIRSGPNTQFYKMAKSHTSRQLASTLIGVTPLGYCEIPSGVQLFGGKTANGAYIYKSSDFGRTFTQMTQAFDATYTAQSFDFIPGNRVGFIGKKAGNVWYRLSRDNGKTWGAVVNVGSVPEGLKALTIRCNSVQGTLVLLVSDGATFTKISKKFGANGSWEVPT